jgi:phage shock protein PspC (stress-responsive transcriptional regulator)
MKKTIQIHLGGINFSVEADAYQKLNAYLEAIKKYFSTFEGSEEIVSDIESRIAEKLFDKSKADAIVEHEDVDMIIKSMGTVSDFEAFKDLEAENLNETTARARQPHEKTAYTSAPLAGSTGTGSQTRYARDGRRKALGGVLAGLSHIWNLDVVWLRILFIVLAFGLLDIGAGGFFFLAYLIGWAVMPERNDLEEDQSIRKLYRDPEHKVLGGVAAGLSSYLKIDVVVLRIVMVILGCFGIGILLYIIFWIVVPTANTLTQKMQLAGKPVTIENIEQSLINKSSSEPRVESSFSKLLLFPFRILSSFLGFFGVIIKPVGSLLKILSGVLLLLFGITIGIGVLIATGMFFGLVMDSSIFQGSEFFGLFRKDLPPLAGFFGFLLIFVPAAAISIVGLSFITGKKYGNQNFWLTTLSIWFAGLVGSAAVGSRYALNFKNRETMVEETQIQTRNTLFLDIKSDFNDDEEFRVDPMVNFNTATDGKILLEKRFTASGSSDAKALENARKMQYDFVQTDSVLIFPEYAKFKSEIEIRNQDLTLNLNLPKGQKFRVSERFAERLMARSWDLARKYGVEVEDMKKFTFEMGEDDEVLCLDCPKLNEEEQQRAESRRFSNTFDNLDFDYKEENPKNFTVGNFQEIEIGNTFNIIVEESATYSVRAFGDENELKNLVVEVNNGVLDIRFKDRFVNHDDNLTLRITCPKITNLNLSGATKTKVLGFKNLQNLKVDLSGSSLAGLDINAENLSLDLSGASNITLLGDINKLDAELSGASYLDAKSVNFKDVKIDASGASEIKLGKVSGSYNTNLSGASSVIKD